MNALIQEALTLHNLIVEIAQARPYQGITYNMVEHRKWSSSKGDKRNEDFVFDLAEKMLTESGYTVQYFGFKDSKTRNELRIVAVKNKN